MRVHVLTLFPEMFGSPLAAGVLRRARERGVLEISLHQLRDYAGGRHLQVDDTPYGGGQGMVMKPEPVVAAIEHITATDSPRRILLSPQGAVLSHARARALAHQSQPRRLHRGRRSAPRTRRGCASSSSTTNGRWARAVRPC